MVHGPRQETMCFASLPVRSSWVWGMGGWHVYFNALAELERGGIALEVQAFCCRALQVFAVGTGVAKRIALCTGRSYRTVIGSPALFTQHQRLYVSTVARSFLLSYKKILTWVY